MTKARFDEIYVAPDPRPYYRELSELDYQVPEHGCRVFRMLADTIRENNGRDVVRVVDLCCSYGINAGLMKHDVLYADIVDHYGAEASGSLNRDEMLARDREFFGRHPSRDDVEVVGIDASEPAIRYATEAGLLDRGIALDLETETLSQTSSDVLSATDLVTVTGGIGYVTDTTVGKVLDAADEEPWLAALCLRWVDFEPIAIVAAEHGLVTERLPDVTFPQRRFADADEEEFVLRELARLGIDPDGKESDGYHHTDLFVARPAADVDAHPLEELFATSDFPTWDSVDDQWSSGGVETRSPKVAGV
ncbi:MAG: hypothetical protein JJE46_14910 [Acidimicrobiia bacterium]|nr:hypothetical protein [Acidimicrobiia bacterium]